ncbi:hypothetical protein SLS56_008298 [Neofusicoccum ribis]|uniref:Uncharacterized protein n=1 Tax=Neofusicoccum ribis TaxID=45134 RepID=A0ABR3SKI9_9PEZI
MKLSDSATMTPSGRATSDPPVPLSPRKLRSSTNSIKRERADSTDRGADLTRFLEALTETSNKRGRSVYPDGSTSFVFAGKPRSSGTTKRAKTEANAGASAPETASATNQPRRGKRVSPTQGAATGQRAGDALKSGAGPANDDGKHDDGRHDHENHDYEKHDYKKHNANHARTTAREPQTKREDLLRSTARPRAANNPTTPASAPPQPTGTAQRRSGLTGKLDGLAIRAAAESHGRPGAL